MRVNNQKRGAAHKYDVMFANGKWFAWFVPYQITQDEKMSLNKEMMNGGDNG